MQPGHSPRPANLLLSCLSTSRPSTTYMCAVNKNWRQNAITSRCWQRYTQLTGNCGDYSTREITGKKQLILQLTYFQCTSLHRQGHQGIS